MNKNENVETLVWEDYSRPMGHLYIDDSVEGFLTSNPEKTSFFKQFVKDVVEGYKDAFIDLYSSTKKGVKKVKSKLSSKSIEDSNYLLEASKMNSEDKRVLLSDVMRGQVLNRVENYFAGNNYDVPLMEKVRTAYELSVKNNLLALDNSEVENILVETMKHNQDVSKSTLLNSYVDKFVSSTIKKAIYENSAVSRYVIPKMDLSLYNKTPAILN